MKIQALSMAALLGITVWAGAGSPAAPQGAEEALRPLLLDRSVDPPSPALPTLASRLGAASAALAPGAEQRPKVLGSYGRLPLSFIENQGQADARVAYYIQSPSRSLYFTRDGHTLRLTQVKGDDAKAHTIKVELVGAAAERIESLQHAPGIVSYFKGPKDQWKTAIPTHARIGYVQPWPGIDLAYAGAGGRLESIYTVAPYADPAQIKLRYSGQDSLRLDEHGNLVYTTSLGKITETAPVLYQEIGGSRVAVEGRFILLDENTVTFQVAQYNPGYALVIDPTLAFASYIGGSGSDFGYAIAVDSTGNTYITGETQSPNFPTMNPLQSALHGAIDVFVSKINPAGSALIYSTYLGGSGQQAGLGIAVDNAGNAYVTGYTTSSDFPTMNPLQPTCGSCGPPNYLADAFVAKISPSGSALVYSTYLGGTEEDAALGIAVDVAGSAYVTGLTGSADFPTMNSLQPMCGSCPDSADAFVAKINPSGSALAYSTYLGGSRGDVGHGIAVDTAGNAYVTGGTESPDFPLANPLQPHYGGVGDAFVAKINPSGSALAYSTYLGGSANENGFAHSGGIAVDAAGNAYVTGYTESPDFPLANPLQPHYGGVGDAFVSKINPAGSAFVYSTYLGGSEGEDIGAGIAVDTSGNAYITGVTGSPHFPTMNPLQPALHGAQDAFVTKINPAGSALVYSTFLGGSGSDEGAFGIAVDTRGNAYITGFTVSTDFPTVNPLQPSNGGGWDAFVAKIANDLQGSVAVGGAPVVGTKVQLKNLAVPGRATTTTNGAGSDQFDPVASGNYKIIIGTFTVGSPATISGNLTVKGAPSVGTKLKLKNQTTGVVRRTTTDASGNFSFASAAAGKYKTTITPVPVP